MPITDKLDGTIFVEPDVSIGELAHFVSLRVGGKLSGPAFGMTITTPVCDIEVRRNPDRRDMGSAVEEKDAFLLFRNVLEIYPDVSCQRIGVVGLVGNILTSLWSQGSRCSPLPATMRPISLVVAAMGKE